MSNASASVPAGSLLSGRRKWIGLFVLALGVAMIILDATVVNVAVPTIVRDLDLTTTDAEWITSAYSLTFASLLLVSGRLADLFGRRLMFVSGVTLFAIASVGIAASGSGTMLIGMRALQGVAAAMILPASLSVLNAVFVGKDRAVAFAVWGATIGGMAAMGPLVGGYLTTYASWHWAFLINVPIAIGVVIGLLTIVPETSDPAGRRGIDGVGTVLGTVGLGSLVFALIEGQRYGWFRPIAPFSAGSFTWTSDTVSMSFLAFVLSAVSILAFLLYENRRARAGHVVLLDLRLFTIRSFAAGNAVALIVSLGEFGLLFSLPLFLQSVQGYDAMQTGFILVALAIGSFLGSGVGAPLSQRVGSVRVLQLGMALEAVGILAIGLSISTATTGWALAPWLFVYGMGVGFATAQLTGVILSDVPVAESGQASAVQSTSRQVGAAIGTAVLGAALVIGLGATTAALTDRGVPQAAAEQVTAAVKASAGTVIPSLASQPGGDVLVAGASQGFADAARGTAWVAGAFVTLGLIASLALPHPNRKPGDMGGNRGTPARREDEAEADQPASTDGR